MLKKLLATFVLAANFGIGTAQANTDEMKDAYSVPHVLFCNVVIYNNSAPAVFVYYVDMVFETAVSYRPPQHAGYQTDHDRQIVFNLSDGSLNSVKTYYTVGSSPSPNIDTIDCADGRTLQELKEDGQAFNFF